MQRARAAALLLLTLVLAGCSGAAPRAAEPDRSRPTVTRSGTGIMSTDRFPLAGDYRMEWTATGIGRSGCYHGVSIRPGMEGYVSVSVEPGQPASGTTYAYGLDAGQYHLQANSGCAWTVSLVPV